MYIHLWQKKLDSNSAYSNSNYQLSILAVEYVALCLISSTHFRDLIPVVVEWRGAEGSGRAVYREHWCALGCLGDLSLRGCPFVAKVGWLDRRCVVLVCLTRCLGRFQAPMADGDDDEEMGEKHSQ